MTDKERLLDLLASYRITPALDYEPELGDVSDAELVTLEAKQGGVQGYKGFYCQFAFWPDGRFYSVGVWE